MLYDLGVVSTPEPFQRLVSQGMILGEVEFTAHRDPVTGAWAAEDAPGAVPVRCGGEDCNVMMRSRLAYALHCSSQRDRFMRVAMGGFL